jgi:hypothetical protein
MKELHSEIEIAASAERVGHPHRLRCLSSVEPLHPSRQRRARGGEHLEVRLESPDSRGITLRPTVLRAEPNRQLRWLGHLLVPGIFDGEHTLATEPLEENRVRFVQHEVLKGVLVPLVARSLANTLRGFEEMNGALKEQAEALSEGTDPRTSETLHR